MFQSVPRQVVPSPARLGLSNPNSPSLQSPSASKPTSQQVSQSHQSNQQITLLTPKITSPTLLSLLPPLSRAQALLLQMASLATKIFDVSSNRASWVSAFRGSLPTFLSSQIQSMSIPTLDSSVSNTKEITSLVTSLQTQLFEAVSELQEILDLEDTRQKLNHEIEIKNAKILSFTKKLKEAERVLDILIDDYADYRRPKRSKSEDTENSSTTTIVASQLKLSDVISYAHKISYTTFAPPEFGAGGPLRGALPPAPQEDQMRASQLYAFSDLDVGLPKMAEDKERAIEPLIEIHAIPEPDPMEAIKGQLPSNFSVPVPAGWQPGMPVELLDLPLPPAGWKPGDPIPLPPLESAPLLPPKSVHQQPRPAPPSAPTRVPEVVHVRPVDIRLPGLDDSSDEYSTSSEEISDDED
ncbi:mediator of RNA polymerase II transcription subunit 4-like [Silene latifolia]|uniref:mediator of RNA polymerase II transcription subunit 4-like n=1 Tax=Silene latifolia TaxID=37657 RepID=UPI003D785225